MSLKCLMILADGISSELIFNNIDKFPNTKKLINNGVGASYYAYANGGGFNEYTSALNQGVIYTGLSPFLVNFENIKRECNKNKTLFIDEINKNYPFWKAMNDNNYRVGVLGNFFLEPSLDINGYFFADKIDFSVVKQNNNEVPVKFLGYDSALKQCGIDNEINFNFILPKTVEMLGFTWEEILKNPKIIEDIISNKEYYESIISGFKEYTNIYTSLIINNHKNYPVDFLLWFNLLSDTIMHFCSYDENILIEVYSIIDNSIKILMENLKPDNIIILSDHGNWNLGKTMSHPDKEVLKEAFSSSDSTVFRDDGKIVFLGRDHQLLFSAHSIDGFLIFSGKDIKKSVLKEVTTQDIYPTILELMNIEVPKDREGFVLDIFNKDKIINKKILLNNKKIKYKNIAIIQNGNFYETDQVISEVFYRYRFSKITVIGETKYGSIFLNNPRVHSFISLDSSNYKILIKEFDRVFTCFYNDRSKTIKCIEISK